MTDIQYWEDTLIEEIEAVSQMLDRAASDSQTLERAKARLRSAAGTKRSFKMEIRLITSVQQRRKYEGRLAELDSQFKTLQSDIKALESESHRNELMDGDRNAFNKDNAQQDGDQLLKEASNLQDKTQDSLFNTKQMIAQSKEVGVSTLEELERQRGVIENIEKETDRIDDNLARAEVLLKQFGKRMASDHFIQCFALINMMLLLGVILYAIIKKGGLSGDEATPNSPVRYLRN